MNRYDIVISKKVEVERQNKWARGVVQSTDCSLQSTVFGFLTSDFRLPASDFRLRSSFKLTITLLIGLIIFNSCTEKIDIELGTTYTRLVVDGKITPEQGEQYVRLTKTADYFSNLASPDVSGATVSVDNGDSLVQFAEDIDNPGYYYAPEDFIGTSRSSYQLSIELSEPINGVSNYEAHEVMPQLAEIIDSVVVEMNPQFKMWMVRLYALDPPTTDFYMFNGMVNGVIITDSVSRVNISDDRLYNGNYTSGAVVLFLNENEVQPGDTFTLILSNITKEYADYMMGLQTEIQPHDPMFSGPPANVSTNISNDAVGYFAAFPSAFISTTVKAPE